MPWRHSNISVASGVVALGLLALLPAAGCGGSSTGSADVLLITLDTLRYDGYVSAMHDSVDVSRARKACERFVERFVGAGLVLEVYRTLAPAIDPLLLSKLPKKSAIRWS